MNKHVDTLEELQTRGAYNVDGVVHRFPRDANIVCNVPLRDVPVNYKVLTTIKRGYAVLSDIADKIGVRFVALGGTLLGVLRFGGVLPWDDDLDIGLTLADFVRFYRFVERCRREGVNLGLDVYWVAIGAKIQYTHVDADGTHTTVIDVFLMDDTGDKVVYGGMLYHISIYGKDHYIASHTCRHIFPWIEYDKRDIGNIREATFEGMRIYIPENVEAVLNVNYRSTLTLEEYMHTYKIHVGNVNTHSLWLFRANVFAEHYFQRNLLSIVCRLHSAISRAVGVLINNTFQGYVLRDNSGKDT